MGVAHNESRSGTPNLTDGDYATAGLSFLCVGMSIGSMNGTKADTLISTVPSEHRHVRCARPSRARAGLLGSPETVECAETKCVSPRVYDSPLS